VGLCPYQVVHQDKTVQLFDCDLTDGKCYAFCPRTPADYEALRRVLFPAGDVTPEIGAVRGYYFSRAADPGLRESAQHGGTVTALLEVALAEGVIHAAIVASPGPGLVQEGRRVETRNQLRDFAGSRFTVSPTVAAFHRAADDGVQKVGVVATPCQALAFAKMKTSKIPGYRKAESPTLVIGLFCGWTLSMQRLQSLMERYRLSAGGLVGMDIPPGKNILELQTSQGITEVPLSEVDACVRTACRYCIDSTAEYADLSVGAARFGAGEEMRGWNQVIVRSARGEELLERARAAGLLEIREAPAQALKDLKDAAREKKKKALKNIVEKSRSAKNLLYLQNDDPVVKKYLRVEKKRKERS